MLDRELVEPWYLKTQSKMGCRDDPQDQIIMACPTALGIYSVLHNVGMLSILTWFSSSCDRRLTVEAPSDNPGPLRAHFRKRYVWHCPHR